MDSGGHELVKVHAYGVGIRAGKQRGIRGDTEARCNGCAHTLHRYVVPAFAAHSEVMVLLLTVHVHGKRKVLRGLKEVKFLFKQ